MGKIRLTEKQLRSFVKAMLVEQNEEEYYKISGDEFEELMKLSGYHGKGLSKIKKFGGKPIWIEGDLDLSDTPTDSLGNVKYINGKLDIRHTNISDLSGVVVKGYTWDGGTPIERKRLREILQGKRNDAQQRRQDDEWNLENTDGIGLRAHALYQYLVNNREIDEMDEDEKEELNRKKTELQVLNQQYDESEEHNDELSTRISNLETEIEELESKNVDVYNIIPIIYGYYGLRTFEVIDVDDLSGHEYAVGDDDQTENAAIEYAENYVDEVGLDGFNRNFIEDYLDEDSIRSYFEDFYYDDVRENPDVYFSPEDFGLSEDQENRVDELEDYIEKLQGIKLKLEEKQERLEDEIESGEEYSEQWNILQGKIDTCEKQIDEAQEEIDNMEPDGEPTPAMIEQKVNEMVDDKMSNPADSLNEFGMDIKDYIDTDGLAKGLVESDGYGIMSSYDGTYDTQEIEGETYYIFRIS